MGFGNANRGKASDPTQELYDPATGQAVDRAGLLSSRGMSPEHKMANLAMAIISAKKGYKWRPKQTPPTQTAVPPVATAEVTPQVPPVVSQPPNPATEIAQTILQQPAEPAPEPRILRRRSVRPWWEDSV